MKYVLILMLCFGYSVSTFAQHGGKAEPRRIQFASGKPVVVLTGMLSNSQELEYVFGATKGQTVTIRNSNRNLFDFRVFSEEHFPEGDFDSSPTYTFEIPATGDYMFFVRKKQVRTPRMARYSLSITLR